jgi:hypothetical protein
MVMKMFATLDKGKSNTANINGLNLAAVKLTIAQVSKLPQYKVGMIYCTKPGLTKA